MTRRGIDLVYGGGNVGLMGIMADSVLARGGHVIGVIPEMLVSREVAHLGLPDLRVVRTMHERKALMASLADAFVALPGGFGTFEELFEALTWTQLGLHDKRCGVLNVNGFYDAALEMLDRSVDDGFLKVENRACLDVATDPEALLARLAEPLAPRDGKWIRSTDEL
jgi:uncharacterized protein (TIGR00730 family)